MEAWLQLVFHDGDAFLGYAESIATSLLDKQPHDSILVEVHLKV
jgi:hypothetical protein